MDREFKNWTAAVRLLMWLTWHPECIVFDLDNEVFTTRLYTGRRR